MHLQVDARFSVDSIRSPLGSSNYYLVLRQGSGLGVFVLSSCPTKLRLLLLLFLLLDVIGVVCFLTTLTNLLPISSDCISCMY